MTAAEPVETADSKPAAQERAAEWAARLTSMGLEKTHGIAIRFTRLPGRAACWGIFVEPQPVAACPCGTAHPMTPEIREAYENIAQGLPDTVRIVTGGRARLVPRVYIAAHGLNAADLPALAEQYGFTGEGTA